MTLRSIELTEHRTTTLSRNELTGAQAGALLAQHGKMLNVRAPFRPTDDWEVMPAGWVGAFRLDRETQVILRPKMPVANLARMLEIAYSLPVVLEKGTVVTRGIPGLFDALVRELARRSLGISRQGLHHEYRAVQRDLQAVRGRIDLAQVLRRPAMVSIPCRFGERTPDVRENQILLRGLELALGAGICSPAVQATAREAYKRLASDVSLVALGPTDTIISYTRLTERYQQAHAIARVIIEGSVPDAALGEEAGVPFLLYMPRLFEQFVTKWLERSLPPTYEVTAQARHTVGDRDPVPFFIDVVVRDRASHKTLCVLDTKYKDAAVPQAHDLAQVGYYSLLEGCNLAGLVVPIASASAWSARSPRLSSFVASFDVAADVEEAGQAFVADVVRRIEEIRPVVHVA